MKIPPDALIPRAKLTKYLLVWQEESDKSKFLAQAGFTLDDPDDLEIAIRQLIVENEAVRDRYSEKYGTYYRVVGKLVGTLSTLNVITVWIQEVEDAQFRFITLKPYR